MSSAGNRKDVMSLLAVARKNGGQIVRLPNGHFKVFNPANGQHIQVWWSPRSPRYLQTLRKQLESLGLL